MGLSEKGYLQWFLRDLLLDDTLRRVRRAGRVGSEFPRGAGAGVFADESSLGPLSEVIAKAGEVMRRRLANTNDTGWREAKKPGGGAHRPSMGQDMVKGRRTEIEFLNGFAVVRREEIGLAARANAAREYRYAGGAWELRPDPKHITELRLNDALSVLVHLSSTSPFADAGRRPAAAGAGARDAGMPAVAITESPGCSAPEFSQACAAKGVQPIVGCQIALSRDGQSAPGSGPAGAAGAGRGGPEQICSGCSSSGFLED